MTLALRFAARSHQGLLRTLNEDSVYAGPRLLAVADGMGGHAAGEVASAVAIAALAPLDEDAPGPDLLATLRVAAHSANTHLHAMVEADGELHGMGTTLVAVLFAGSRLGLLHVGDSRAYLLRAGELTQITHDHTLVQVLVDEGRINEQEASSHPQRNVITRALDGRSDLELDLSVREVRSGDRYLLCSDGLTGPVGSLETLREALQLPDPQEAVDRLVQLALKGGGPDNITVIVADALEADTVAGRPVVVAGAASDSPQPPPPDLASSPASRAQVAEGRDVAADPPLAPVATPTRRRALRTVGVLGVLVLFAVGGLGGFGYIRSQYYVGLDGSDVAVYRGVRGTLAGVHFSSVQEKSTLRVDQLPDLQREQVRDGVVATDLASAHAIVQRLRAQAGCPADTAAPIPTAASPAQVVTSPTTRPTTRPTTAPTPAPITAPAPVPAASAGSCP